MKLFYHPESESYMLLKDDQIDDLILSECAEVGDYEAHRQKAAESGIDVNQIEFSSEDINESALQKVPPLLSKLHSQPKEKMRMNVYDVKVRVMRKMQVKDYEPVEGEITLSAALAEGDNHILTLDTLSTDAAIALHQALKKAVTGKADVSGGTTVKETTVTTATSETKADAPKATSTRGKPTETKAASKTTKTETKAAPASEFPDEAPANTTAPAADDEFGEAPADGGDEFGEAPAERKPMAAKDLTDWINGEFKGALGNDAINHVKELYKTMGVKRTADLTDAQRIEVEDSCRAKMKAKGK